MQKLSISTLSPRFLVRFLNCHECPEASGLGNLTTRFYTRGSPLTSKFNCSVPVLYCALAAPPTKEGTLGATHRRELCLRTAGRVWRTIRKTSHLAESGEHRLCCAVASNPKPLERPCFTRASPRVKATHLPTLNTAPCMSTGAVHVYRRRVCPRRCVCLQLTSPS